MVEQTWQERVAEVLASGEGKPFQPNGEPICCIRHDGLMLECEHGDHQTYRFPVLCTYVGERDPKAYEWEYGDELVALIYTDGCIALTMHECCYDLWLLRGGGHLYGLLKGYRLTDDSIAKCREVGDRQQKAMAESFKALGLPTENMR